MFAAGDVIGPPVLASVSMEQARVAVCHAFGFEYKNRDRSFLARRYVFSIPEVAWVGPHGGAGAPSGVEYEVGRCVLRHERQGADLGVSGRPREARVPGARQGAARRAHRRRARQRARPHRAVRMHEGGTIDHFIDATFAVPTRSEAYKYAAYDGLMRLERRRTTAPTS